MTHVEIVRAWKDADYRDNLGDDARRRLPTYPAGLIELTDADMGALIGGAGTTHTYQLGCTWELACFTKSPVTCLATPGTRSPGSQPPAPPPVIKGWQGGCCLIPN